MSVYGSDAYLPNYLCLRVSVKVLVRERERERERERDRECSATNVFNCEKVFPSRRIPA